MKNRRPKLRSILYMAFKMFKNVCHSTFCYIPVALVCGSPILRRLALRVAICFCSDGRCHHRHVYCLRYAPTSITKRYLPLGAIKQCLLGHFPSTPRWSRLPRAHPAAYITCLRPSSSSEVDWAPPRPSLCTIMQDAPKIRVHLLFVHSSPSR